MVRNSSRLPCGIQHCKTCSTLQSPYPSVHTRIWHWLGERKTHTLCTHSPCSWCRPGESSKSSHLLYTYFSELVQCCRQPCRQSSQDKHNLRCPESILPLWSPCCTCTQLVLRQFLLQELLGSTRIRMVRYRGAAEDKWCTAPCLHTQT